MSVVVIIGTQKGAVVLRSTNDRKEWKVGDLLFKGWIVTAAERDQRGRYYLGATHEVYGTVVMVSDDLASWRQIEKGPRYESGDVGNAEHNRTIGRTDSSVDQKAAPRHLDQIWTLHASGESIYAGVSEAGLFRSDDRGESWRPIQVLNDFRGRDDWTPGFGGLCTHVVLTDPKNPDRLWVGISAVGVFRSDDGGASWTGKNDGVSQAEGYCVHGLAHHYDDADVIYRQDHRGMYRTRDGGDSWQLIENGLPIGTLHDGHRATFGFPIVIDPNTKAVFALPLESDEYHLPHDGKLRVYRTTNGGDSWEPLAGGLPVEPTYTSVLRGAMAVDGITPGGVYFGTTSGAAYASSNGGELWSRLPVTLPRILCVKAFAE